MRKGLFTGLVLRIKHLHYAISYKNVIEGQARYDNKQQNRKLS